MTHTRNWITVGSGGCMLFGILHLPHGVERAPLVIILHGFASNKQGTNRSYIILAEKFAAIGIATLRFDLRGCGDSEGDISVVKVSDWIEDSLAVYRFAQGHERIDGKRIGVYGSSMGGTISILAAPKMNLKALAVWSPIASGELWVHDFMTQHPEFAKEDPRKVLSTYRGIPLHPDFCTQFALLRPAETLKELPCLAFLHQQGEVDKIVSLMHQRVYKFHCEARKAPTKFVTYPDIDHKFAQSESFSLVCERVVDWFKEYL